MSVRILRNSLMILGVMVISIFFSGCTEKVFVDRPVEVKVPVKCQVPKVECFSNQKTYTAEIREMRFCIERYKQAIEVCQK